MSIAKGINYKDSRGRFIAYWLLIVPKELFEEIFIKDSNGEYYLTAVRDSDLKNGKLCGHYTQAFVLWNLEQILKNSKDLSKTIDIYIEDIEQVLTEFYGSKNLTMQYLKEIREVFDVEALNVDPRDWGIIYAHNIYDLLISDEQKRYQSLANWDHDIIKKTQFIMFIVEFFNDKKEHSLAVMNDQLG